MIGLAAASGPVLARIVQLLHACHHGGSIAANGVQTGLEDLRVSHVTFGLVGLNGQEMRPVLLGFLLLLELVLDLDAGGQVATLDLDWLLVILYHCCLFILV